MFHSMRRLSLVAIGVAAGLTLLSGASQALTVSFTANAWDPLVRDSTTGAVATGTYIGNGGIPNTTGSTSTALQVNYNTSGLPYFVSKIVYDANGTTTTFVPSVDGDVGPTPVTIGAGFSSTPGAPTLDVPQKVLTQTFALGEFLQGAVNGEFTYVEIHNGSTVIIGHNHLDPTVLLPPGGDDTTTAAPEDLSAFNGAKVTLTFTHITGEPDTTLGDEFTLSSNFAVQTDVNTQNGDIGFRNTALAGNTINGELITVPEPGSLALLIGMGIGGSGLLLRRRR
jgi:hypothetical protein